MRIIYKHVAVFVLFILLPFHQDISSSLYAQDSINVKLSDGYGGFLTDHYKWIAEVPIWIPGFRGAFAYGETSLEGADGEFPSIVNPIEPEPDPPDDGNILSRLFSKSTFFRFFFVGRVGYKMEKTIFEMDFFSGGIGDKITFRLDEREVARATYTTIMGRAFVGRMLYQHLSKSQKSRFTLIGYLGAKVYWVELYSELKRIKPTLDIEFFWGQPAVGLIFKYTLRDWLFKLQGDIGGLMSQKNYSYMFTASVNYRISKLISLKLGWSDWDLNHQRHFKGEKLVLNVHLSGPNTGITFHF